jgi:hypothetical protein
MTSRKAEPESAMTVDGLPVVLFMTCLVLG